MYGLLTKCEVKMAGYWPSSFFACLWTETKSRWTRKKRTRPISSHLDRTNLINKGFIIWLLGKFCLRDTVGSPEWARSLHLARSGSQSQLAISFILPARGASHIISTIICSGFVLSCYAVNSCWWNWNSHTTDVWQCFNKLAALCKVITTYSTCNLFSLVWISLAT